MMLAGLNLHERVYVAGGRYRHRLHGMAQEAKWVVDCCTIATQLGSMPFLKNLGWLKPVRTWSKDICSEAASMGQLNVLQWLQTQNPPSKISPRRCAVEAAQNGHDATLSWLHKAAFPDAYTNNRAIELAARLGQWTAVKALSTLQHPACPISEEAVRLAVANGQIHVLEWLARYGHRLPHNFLKTAIHNKSHRVKAYMARGLQTACSSDTCCVPAFHGDLAMVQLLESIVSALQWTELLCSALKGSFVPMSEREMERHKQYWKESRSAQHMQVVAWIAPRAISVTAPKYLPWQLQHFSSIVPIQLASQGCRPISPWGPAAHSLAAANADLSILKFVLAQSAKKSYKDVHASCPGGRMLLLNHGHGWKLPGELQPHLQAAEKTYFVFQRLMLRQHQEHTSSTGLCDLPAVFIKAIACTAGVDFSWALSA